MFCGASAQADAARSRPLSLERYTHTFSASGLAEDTILVLPLYYTFIRSGWWADKPRGATPSRHLKLFAREP
jgi:hypothetical protein